MGTLIGNLLGKLPSNLLRQIFKLVALCLSRTGTQALVRPGSPHSSISAEDRSSLATICKAKALVDSLPNPYDKEALKFKVSSQHTLSKCSIPHVSLSHSPTLARQKGELIDVLSMNASGIWKGRCHGRVGHFKFINVEVLPELPRMKTSSSKTLAPGTAAARLANSGGTGGGSNNGNSGNINSGPSSVEDLLVRIGLKEYTSVFVLNG